MTAILGLLPLTLGGGAAWAPFGWVNIFGLTTSIPLSLVLLPALLALVYRSRRAHRTRADVPGEGESVGGREGHADYHPSQTWTPVAADHTKEAAGRAIAPGP